MEDQPIDEAVTAVQEDVVVEEHHHQEVAIEGTMEQQAETLKEVETTHDVEMVQPVEESAGRLASALTPSDPSTGSEEKKEIETTTTLPEAVEPGKEGEMSKFQVIDEVTTALDQASAPTQGGGAVPVENGNTDSGKDSAHENGVQGAVINNNGPEVPNGAGGEEVKIVPDSIQENGDSKPPPPPPLTVPEAQEDGKMPAEDASNLPEPPVAPPQPKMEETPTETNGGDGALASIPNAAATAAAAAAAAAGVTVTDTEIKDATAQSLVVLKAGPDGQTVAVMPPIQPSKHVKKGEVLKRPQSVTSVVTRNGKTWNEMFDALVAYKEEHGDCYVPDRFKNSEGVCLGLWVRNQRRREKSLTEEQQKRLTELGLDWQTQNERFDNVWHERYAKLTMYRVEHGDCKVPYTYKADPALAKWVSQQRAQQAQGRLAPDRKAKLDAIDFSWKLNTVKNRNTKTEDKKWIKQYDKLVEFHRENGHCKVPDRYKPDRPLGTWVKKQRLANACNQLKEDRKKMLDDLNFVWRITDKTDGDKWDKMFTKLKEYKEENGTCHVSRTVPDSDLKPLARWVKTQRALYKSGKILPDRKARLETIDFVWDGTQLPIKRKRRRPTDEGEATDAQTMMPMPPIKRMKTEETDVEMKANGDDSETIPEKKLAAKRVLPTSAQKADASLYASADSEEAKGAAALKEMGESVSAAQGSNEKVEAVPTATGDETGEASSLSQPAVGREDNVKLEEEGKVQAQPVGGEVAVEDNGTKRENISGGAEQGEGEAEAAAAAAAAALPTKDDIPNDAVAQDSKPAVAGESAEEEGNVLAAQEQPVEGMTLTI